MRRISISNASSASGPMKIALVFALLSGLAASQARAVWGRVDRAAAPVPVQAGAQEEFFRPVRTTSESAQEEFFEKKVRPIFAANCQRCHNAKSKVAGLDLTTAEAFQRGGDSGPVINKEKPEESRLLKEKPEESRLLKVIGYDGETKMPPAGRLKDHEIATLTEWVKMGAPWPGGIPPAASEILS